jgi:glutamine synthetase
VLRPLLAHSARLGRRRPRGAFRAHERLDLPLGRSSLREAIAALESGTMARAALGDQVVDHYLNYARTEQGVFDKAVTEWERMRLFERG